MSQTDVVTTTTCPKCGAIPGQPCHSVTGRRGEAHRMMTLHNERWQVWRQKK